MTLILPFNLFIHYTLQRSTNMTPTLLQQRKEERKRNHFQVSTHSVLQAGPANHAANTCKLADAIQKLRFYLTRHASTPPHWFLSWLSSDFHQSVRLMNILVPLPCLMSGLILHYVTAGHVPSAWKQLKTWTYATTRTDHAFIFFLILPLGKIAKELFWTVLIGVCTQKDNLHARVCTDSISYVYSDFNCSGLCAANIIWCSSRICTRQQKHDIGCEDAQACL